MRVSGALGLLVSGMAVTGAAQVRPTDTPPAATPPPDANIFIYRDHAEPLIWSPTVKIDGQKVAALAQKQYTALHLPSGKHAISIVWPLLARQGRVEAQVRIADGGPPHYLEIMGTSRYGFRGLEMRSAIREWTAELGAARLGACCHFKPAN